MSNRAVCKFYINNSSNINAGMMKIEGTLYDEAGRVLRSMNRDRSVAAFNRDFALGFLDTLCGSGGNGGTINSTTIVAECIGVPMNVQIILADLGCRVQDMTTRPPIRTDSQGVTHQVGTTSRAAGPLPSESGPQRSVKEFVVGEMTPSQTALYNKLVSMDRAIQADMFKDGIFSVEDAKDMVALYSARQLEETGLPEVEFKKPNFTNGRLPVVSGRTQQQKVISFNNDLKAKLPEIMGFSVGAAKMPSQAELTAAAKGDPAMEKLLREQLNQKINVRGNEYKLTQPAQVSGSNSFKIAQDNDDPIVDLSLTNMINQFDDYGENAPIRPSTSKKKRAIQTDGISAKKKRILKEKKNFGQGLVHMVEPAPPLALGEVEVEYKNRYGSSIVLGKDRAHPTDANRGTGYGGLGNTQCASIDIVAGRMSPNPRDVTKEGKPVTIDPIFNAVSSQFGTVVDAARIYMSQKTDIDHNFQLADGKIPKTQTIARSGIAIKADGIRVIGREGIKLVTGGDLINSQGGDISLKTGVNIIANNDDSSLQPMVLGNNLEDALNQMNERISDLVGIVASITTDIGKMNTALAAHSHPSPFFGLPTFIAPILSMFMVQQAVKLASVDAFSIFANKYKDVQSKFGYLKPGAFKHIKSYYNYVN